VDVWVLWIGDLLCSHRSPSHTAAEGTGSEGRPLTCDHAAVPDSRSPARVLSIKCPVSIIGVSCNLKFYLSLAMDLPAKCPLWWLHKAPRWSKCTSEKAAVLIVGAVLSELAHTGSGTLIGTISSQQQQVGSLKLVMLEYLLHGNWQQL
jgi:hypothetical protein